MAVNVLYWKNWAGERANAVAKKMYGVNEVTQMCLIAIATGGHVLLEGNPGLGKTALINTLSDSLGLPFNRIQFTPDLMPQDITGTFMPSFKQTSVDDDGLQFTPGPIFTSLLLADEINRATPKTQSAMLEAMGENKVTVLGKTYQIHEKSFRHDEDMIISGRPFMVAATQNPIDHEGTYALPEAQSDRFMFKIIMPTPSRETVASILGKTTDFVESQDELGDLGQGKSEPDPELLEREKQLRLKELTQSVKKIKQLKNDVLKMKFEEDLKKHVLNIILASNGQFEEITDLQNRRSLGVLKNMFGYIRYGLGPRAATAMMLGAKAYSLLFLEGNNNTASHEALAHVVIPALRHRLQLRFDWAEHFAQSDGLDKVDQDPDLYRDKFIKDFVMTCAPKISDLGHFNTALDNILQQRPF